MKKVLLLILCLTGYYTSPAQLMQERERYTKADTLRGSDNENRDWWDVLKYDIMVKPDYEQKTIEGTCTIGFNVLKEGETMQIDLQDSLMIDKVELFEHLKTKGYRRTQIHFIKNDGVYLLTLPSKLENPSVEIKYHGKPREAVNPPWDGGWVWTKDSLGNPWMSVASQGLGASCWFPCKDIQSDEPDSGIRLSIIPPDSLKAIANGREYFSYEKYGGGLKKWKVKNPINSYDIIPYIGKYANFNDTYKGEGGKLDLSYWVLTYNLEKAKKQFTQVKPTLQCFEYWFGKYPFYEDSYKLVEAPYLGMENQSNVAYGNKYINGYHGTDLSATGWGLKWDFIIVHESAHEWWGNSITSKDIADMWIHESFANYAETLYTEWLFGKEAGNEYCVGTRKRILNDKPIIGPYGVNKEGSGDMYYKGGNMIHNIRHILNNDSLFRKILRGLNTTFYHQTVTTKQIEDYINKQSNIDFQKVFDQYLRTTQIPKLQFTLNKDKQTVTLNWTNCIAGFDMPISIPSTSKRLTVTAEEQTFTLTEEELNWFTAKNLLNNYYMEILDIRY